VNEIGDPTSYNENFILSWHVGINQVCINQPRVNAADSNSLGYKVFGNIKTVQSIKQAGSSNYENLGCQPRGTLTKKAVVDATTSKLASMGFKSKRNKIRVNSKDSKQNLSS
jgi:hypothetical protein